MAASLPMESGQNGPRLGRSVSIDQAAELLHVSRRTIYNRIRDGRLVTIRTIGGSQRVLLESLNELGISSQLLSSPISSSFTVRPIAGN
jgi:excisionase family DNA binding protein